MAGAAGTVQAEAVPGPLVARHRRQWRWFALVWLLLGALLGAELWRERAEIQAHERQRLAQQAGILHANLARQIDAINHALGSLVAYVQRGPAGDDRLQDRLQAFHQAMIGVRSLSVLDARGRVTASSRPELQGEDFSQRPYFLAARAARAPGTLVVSPPFRGALGDWVIVLARAVPGPGGALGGLVSATLDPGEFTTLLASVRYAPDMLAGLTHGDGLRFAVVPGQSGQSDLQGDNLDQPGTLFRQHRDSGQDASLLTGQVVPGGPAHLAAMRTIAPAHLYMDKPLLTGVGRAWDAILAPWRARAWAMGAAYALTALAAAAALGFMQRRWRDIALRQRQLAQQDAQLQERLNRLVGNVPGAIYQFQIEADGRSHFPYVSTGMQEVYAHSPEELSQSGRLALQRVHPEDMQAVQDGVMESARTLAVWRAEYRVILPGRGERWLSGLASPQRLDGGAVLWHGYIQDVTEAKQQALQLQETERVLQHLMNEMPIGLCKVDAAHRIYFRNRRFLQDFGHAETAAPTLHEWALQAYPDPAYRQQVVEIWKEAVAQAAQRGDQIPERDYRITAHDGTQRTVAIGGLVFGGHFLATFVDRTEQQAQSERLRVLAYMDGLTGIANRRYFDQQLKAEWWRCRRSGKPLALVLLDIDYFKQFNDLYGHQQGDECLRAVAATLRGQLGRSHDLVARYGGEEFVCLLPECDLAGATLKAQALCRAVQALGIAHAGSAVAGVVTISLGVACQVPDADGTPEALLERADAHLYRSKSQGRNQVGDSTILLT